jgi:hypothetical protein
MSSGTSQIPTTQPAATGTPPQAPQAPAPQAPQAPAPQARRGRTQQAPQAPAPPPQARRGRTQQAPAPPQQAPQAPQAPPQQAPALPQAQQAQAPAPPQAQSQQAQAPAPPQPATTTTQPPQPAKITITQNSDGYIIIESNKSVSVKISLNIDVIFDNIKLDNNNKGFNFFFPEKKLKPDEEIIIQEINNNNPFTNITYKIKPITKLPEKYKQYLENQKNEEINKLKEEIKEREEIIEKYETVKNLINNIFNDTEIKLLKEPVKKIISDKIQGIKTYINNIENFTTTINEDIKFNNEDINKVKEEFKDKEYSDKNIFFEDIVSKVSNFRTTRKINTKEEEYNEEKYSKYPELLEKSRKVITTVDIRDVIKYMENLKRIASISSGISDRIYFEREFIYAYISFNYINEVKSKFQTDIDSYKNDSEYIYVIRKYTEGIDVLNQERDRKIVAYNEALYNVKNNVMRKISQLTTFKTQLQNEIIQINNQINSFPDYETLTSSDQNDLEVAYNELLSEIKERQEEINKIDEEIKKLT